MYFPAKLAQKIFLWPMNFMLSCRSHWTIFLTEIFLKRYTALERNSVKIGFLNFLLKMFSDDRTNLYVSWWTLLFPYFPGFWCAMRFKVCWKVPIVKGKLIFLFGFYGVLCIVYIFTTLQTIDPYNFVLQEMLAEIKSFQYLVNGNFVGKSESQSTVS